MTVVDTVKEAVGLASGRMYLVSSFHSLSRDVLEAGVGWEWRGKLADSTTTRGEKRRRDYRKRIANILHMIYPPETSHEELETVPFICAHHFLSVSVSVFF